MEGNFIHDIIDEDLRNNVHTKIVTRFPPEPNGYLHIGHSKAICIDFMTALKYGGQCNLRFDDTNPTKEETEFVDSIMEDIKWLGFSWDRVCYASDYFPKMYEYAVMLIESGKAFVCDLSADEIRQSRGTLTEPGAESPYKNRSVEENLQLFRDMKDGKYPDGSKVLRAKIDMASPNLNMRDPVFYRILRATHHRTGDTWCIYPMYDFAHPISDAIEGITHSLCSLEFENHRPLYDWFVREVGVFPNPPRQIEFARLNLTYTLTSKRKCADLVKNNIVNGWDDPRMSTLSAFRRKGFPKEAIIDFIERIGVAKANSVVDLGLLEHCAREFLNENAKRAMVVLDPIKLIIENYPKGQRERLTVSMLGDTDNEVDFSRELYIERDDFMESPPKKYHRLYVGAEVRLMGAYFVKCTGFKKDGAGNISHVYCTYDPLSKGGQSPDGRKVKGTIHYVEVESAIKCTTRLYDTLFTNENPSDDDTINENSLVVHNGCVMTDNLKNAKITEPYQFLRNGYFCKDKDSTPECAIFNRIVPLKSKKL